MKKLLNVSLILIKDFSKLVGGILLITGMVYLTGCNNDDENDQSAQDQAAYDAADRVNGGRLYDKFWASVAVKEDAYIFKGVNKLYCIKESEGE